MRANCCPLWYTRVDVFMSNNMSKSIIFNTAAQQSQGHCEKLTQHDIELENSTTKTPPARV